VLNQFNVNSIPDWIAFQDDPIYFLRLPKKNACQNQGQTTAGVPLLLNIAAADIFLSRSN
jgi:hypothetical protein